MILDIRISLIADRIELLNSILEDFDSREDDSNEMDDFEEELRELKTWREELRSPPALVVVTSSVTPGCFGVYANDELAYKDIKTTYGQSVKTVDRVRYATSPDHPSSPRPIHLAGHEPQESTSPQKEYLMWTVECEFGPVMDFDTREEADTFAAKENAKDGEGTYWVLYSTTY